MDKLLAALEARLAKKPPTREQLDLYLALLDRKGLSTERLEVVEKELKAQALLLQNLMVAVSDIRNMMGVAM